MAYKPATRNWDKIQYETLRKKVDGKFNDAHDELSAIYYDQWMHGDFSTDFQGHKPASQEEAKPLFDKLHGLIFLLREIVLNQENEKEANPNERLRTQLHEIPEGETKKPIEKTIEKINQLKKEGIELTIE